MRPHFMYHKNIVDRQTSAMLIFASTVKLTLKKPGENFFVKQKLKAVLTTDHHKKTEFIIIIY